MNIGMRVCEIANREHEASMRQYAHVGHHPNIICVADAYFDLPRDIKLGILYHELGHIAGAEEELEADRLAERIYGVRIARVDTPYGDSLECIV